MSDTAYYILGEMIVTIGLIYRAQTISSRNYLKDEDAFIPIKRKEGEVGIIRGRVPWECAGILLNGILFIITILIKTKIQGKTDFLYSNIVFLWIMFTGFLYLFRLFFDIFTCLQAIVTWRVFRKSNIYSASISLCSTK